MSENSQYQNAVQSAINQYAHAIENQSFFDCVKALGVLEYLNVPDIDYYTAFAYHMNHDYQKAAEFFQKINSTSPHYDFSRQSLAIDYVYLGDYSELDSLIKSGSYKCSSMKELEDRISCLQHMNSTSFHSEKINMSMINSRSIPAGKYEGVEAEAFFRICRAFVTGLVIVGECINQCLNYQINTKSSIEDFEANQDVGRFVQEYDKWCTILSLSSAVEIIKLPASVTSLSVVGLSDRTWPEKLRIFSSSNYIKQVMQIIFTLCRPEIHSEIDSIECILQILEAFIHIQPRALAQVVDHYFDDISAAYQIGNPDISQYIGYVYSEILATGHDPFSLKERIDTLRFAESQYNYHSTADHIRLTRSMSRKGHDAFLNAISTFEKTKQHSSLANDYSALSLQFFRVIEVEYCEKLIIPLTKIIDIQHMCQLAERNQKKWSYDIDRLNKVLSGNQSSFEVGAVRTFLSHLIGYWTKDDPCAQYLLPLVESLLTEEGKQALHSKQMLDIIGDYPLQKYRVPGAHTGFLPYSVAVESKKYVENNLMKIVQWFV